MNKVPKRAAVKAPAQVKAPAPAVKAFKMDYTPKRNTGIVGRLMRTLSGSD